MKKLLLLLSVVLFSISCEKDGISEPDSRVVIDYKLSGTYETTPLVELKKVTIYTPDGKIITNQNTAKNYITELKEILKVHFHNSWGEEYQPDWDKRLHFWFDTKSIHINDFFEDPNSTDDFKFKIHFKHGKAFFRDVCHELRFLANNDYYDIIQDNDLLILSSGNMKLPENIDEFYHDYSLGENFYYPTKINRFISYCKEWNNCVHRINYPLVKEDNTISVPGYKVIYYSEYKSYEDNKWHPNGISGSFTDFSIPYWYPNYPTPKNREYYGEGDRETIIVQEFRIKLMKI